MADSAAAVRGLHEEVTHDAVIPAPAGGLRVLVVDARRMFAEALSRFLAEGQGVEWVGAAANVERAHAMCLAHRPHVVLMAASLPGNDGITGTRELRREFRDTRVLIVSELATRDLIGRALEAGASGVVLATNAPDDLLGLLKRAAAGEIVLPEAEVAAVVRRLDEGRSERRTSVHMLSRLTARETDVLEKLTAGCGTAEVARDLHVSPLTVRSHVKSILAKLGVHSKLEAVTYALRNGLVDTPQPD